MLRKYKFDVWDIIIWISLLVLVAYIIAKLTGLIKTPEWVNLIPVITLVFFAGAFYQKVLGFMERMFVRTDYLKKNLDNVNGQLNNISSKLLKHDKQLTTIAYKLSNYSERPK